MGDFGSLVKIVCDEAEFGQSQYDEFFTDLPDENRIPIEGRLNQQKDDCSWLMPIQVKSDRLYKDSTDGIHIPTMLYLFKFDHLWNDFSQDRLAGYFESSTECEAHRESFEAKGLSAEDCESRLVF